MTNAHGILEIADRLDREQDKEEKVVESSETWVSFSVGGGGFALPLDHLRGAHRVEHITPVPQGPEGLRGLSNLRGRVRPVVDLGVHLGLGRVELGESSRILEVEIEGRSLGLLVDRTEHLAKIFPSLMRPLSEDFDPRIRMRASGLVDTSTGHVVLLDPNRLLNDNAQPSYLS